LNNLVELKRGIYDYEMTAGEDVRLQDYLDHVSLLTSEDRSAARETVRLMTIHAAKGLEFSFVFVCGLNEEIFPSRNTTTPEEMEEERRFAYVAMTRAEYGLSLSDAEGYHIDEGFRHPSRFVFNVGKENLEYVVALRSELEAQANRLVQRQTSLQQKQFSVDDTIFHPIFGTGRISVVDEEEHKYIIQFEGYATERSLRFGSPLQRR